MGIFDLVSKHKPAGDQPQAIKKLTEGVEKGYARQTLLGVTGSGKTFTAANVIANVGKPALVVAHNKTLAAQLTNEFRELFPQNSVNYFVSYYDYYQPEAYIPSSDTYIGKEAMINDEIDKLRHAATVALLTRRDVIVVASVSCIYGLGAPEAYAEGILRFRAGERIDRAKFLKKLVELHFTRTTADLTRGTFRTRGDNWEIMPTDKEVVYTFTLSGGAIEKIYEVDPVEGFRPGKTPEIPEIVIAPAKHFITPVEERERAIKDIKKELKEQLAKFEKEKKYLEAERLERRTKFDLAMIREIGYCNGIENYSRHLSGRVAGEPPDTLLDYFPKKKDGSPDFLTIIDESHVTVSQIEGMYHGDASRKKTLIEYGFRLPSAADNRPLTFKEFNARIGQVIFTSATPGDYEIKISAKSVEHFVQTNTDRTRAGAKKGVSDLQRTFSESQRLPGVVEQIIRPTGLVDPKITIRPVRGQIDDLIPRIEERVAKKERVLVTTLTKRMAEDLAAFLQEGGKVRSGEHSRTAGESTLRQAQSGDKQPIKVAYLHSDVKTLDRIKILTNLRRGTFDVLVGVNLLREGLDLPEVTLVAILDADKEGFLRSETSLIQTIGRAARNVAGEVVMYADNITGSIERAVRETDRRRKKQLAYNKEHHITPKTIVKEIKDILPAEEILALETLPIPKSKRAVADLVKKKEIEMREAAKNLDFELASILRDEIRALTKETKK